MTELEKIEYTKSYMDKLANGINPLDDTPIPEGDLANNVRLSRCFFYVSDILRQVIENGGINPPTVRPERQPRMVKEAFHLSEEARATLKVTDTPLSVSEIASLLNDTIDDQAMKKISAPSINSWLVDRGFLEVVERPNGKTQKLPTADGRELGILTEEKIGQYGPYTAVLFSASAQAFIYDHIGAVVELYEQGQSAKKEQREAAKAQRAAARAADKDTARTAPVAFLNRPWTEEHDDRLKSLYVGGATLSEIAFALRRTEEGVATRLMELGWLGRR